MTLITAELVREVLRDERERIGLLPHLDQAAELFERVALADEFVDFLTVVAYDLID